ncbi:UbiX family flavin prenyltransferase [Breznakiella homolactica]|uniref:Flavin prenyltransferase UbiX n=1 Tax=Breznakiella homolactica TaxID=2798577 RepID=A0A7T8BCM5_9SPIR|nr:UbiX family flavin prenyltransferase [Breznakiella homolactica]QQO10428.1 UbiX family flavin prenyltransferase [Breznakiella homolactica]
MEIKNGRYLICITGASGSVYGLRTIKALTAAGHEVHGVISRWGMKVIEEETKRPFASWLAELNLPAERVYPPEDLSAPPASGSFRLDGTVIVPCSMSSAGTIASGISVNLIHRAALVALKEGRPLVLVPRETPMSVIDLRNLTALAEAGAAVLPAAPGFYHGPKTIDDLVDFVAGKILDRLSVDHTLFKRWSN